jgi:mediator of RNA polymerase II transcription subunit 7
VPKTVPVWTLDRGFYLKKIVRSILLNYLELIAIVSQDPVPAKMKVQHIEQLFINAHYIINQYRPHQARESLILMTEERIAKIKAEIDAVKEMKAKMEALHTSLPFNLEDMAQEMNGKSPHKSNEHHQVIEATLDELDEEIVT